jgi:Lar family restriction alleviation protein
MDWPDHKEIEECPHCGCDALDLINQNEDLHYIECRICDLSGPTQRTPSLAVKVWNDLNVG